MQKISIIETTSLCNNWKMKINRDKTKSFHFRKQSIPRVKHDFNLDENNIDIVDKYKYLGIYFDEFLDFKYTTGSRELVALSLNSILFKMWGFKLILDCVTVGW